MAMVVAIIKAATMAIVAAIFKAATMAIIDAIFAATARVRVIIKVTTVPIVSSNFVNNDYILLCVFIRRCKR